MSESSNRPITSVWRDEESEKDEEPPRVAETCDHLLVSSCPSQSWTCFLSPTTVMPTVMQPLVALNLDLDCSRPTSAARARLCLVCQFILSGVQ